MSTIICSLLLFFFFVCLSMHTSNARHLRVPMDDDNASHKKYLFSTKGVESVKHLNKDEAISVHGEERSGDCIIFRESHAVKPKDSNSLLREMKENREILSVGVPMGMKPVVSVASHSGRVPRKNLDERSAKFKPSTHVSLLRATSIEGSRRRALSMVVVEVEQEHGSHSQSFVKQGKDDASVTDYEPPHQKPPIHNRQT